MKKKKRLILVYGGVGVGTVLACILLVWWLAQRDDVDSLDGLALGVTDIGAAPVPARAPTLKFEAIDVAFSHFPGRRTHVLPEDMGSGVALEDFDGDGRPDLFFVNNGPLGVPPPPCVVLRNRGDGVFEPVDTPLPALRGMGVAAGDYDADGDFDLYVTGYKGNVLLRNDGDFRFTDVTDAAGVVGGGFSAGACWGDADGDGDLDLYVCCYVTFTPATRGEARRGAVSLPATLNPSVYPAPKSPNLCSTSSPSEGAWSARSARAKSNRSTASAVRVRHNSNASCSDAAASSIWLGPTGGPPNRARPAARPLPAGGGRVRVAPRERLRFTTAQGRQRPRRQARREPLPHLAPLRRRRGVDSTRQ